MINRKIKILFLASNPKQTPRIMLDEEIRAIEKQLESSPYGRDFELVSAWAVRPSDLLHELNEHRPSIVHFSGHGSDAGEIILTDDDGKPLHISKFALESLFLTFKDNIRLIVLNSCYSRQQAEAVSNVIDCVVGMKTSIPDDVAITFAAQFYGALGSCRSVKNSFDQGIVAIKLESLNHDIRRSLDLTNIGYTDADIPDLICRNDINPALISFFSEFDGQEVEQPQSLQRRTDVVSLGETKYKLVHPDIFEGEVTITYPRISQEEAKQNIQTWINKNTSWSSELTFETVTKDMQCLYAPLWVIDASADAEWSAVIGKENFELIQCIKCGGSGLDPFFKNTSFPCRKCEGTGKVKKVTETTWEIKTGKVGCHLEQNVVAQYLDDLPFYTNSKYAGLDDKEEVFNNIYSSDILAFESKNSDVSSVMKAAKNKLNRDIEKKAANIASELGRVKSVQIVSCEHKDMIARVWLYPVFVSTYYFNNRWDLIAVDGIDGAINLKTELEEQHKNFKLEVERRMKISREEFDKEEAEFNKAHKRFLIWMAVFFIVVFLVVLIL